MTPADCRRPLPEVSAQPVQALDSRSVRQVKVRYRITRESLIALFGEQVLRTESQQRVLEGGTDFQLAMPSRLVQQRSDGFGITQCGQAGTEFLALRRRQQIFARPCIELGHQPLREIRYGGKGGEGFQTLEFRCQQITTRLIRKSPKLIPLRPACALEME